MKLSKLIEQGGAHYEDNNIRVTQKITELKVDIEVIGSLDCAKNNLTTLEINHAIGGGLHCYKNNLTSLEINNVIGGLLDCSCNKLTTKPTYERLQQGQKGEGWIYADNRLNFIKKESVKQGYTIYNLLRNNVLVTQDNETFAHGKTVKDAIIDLKFKLADRDKSDYEDLTLDSELDFEDENGEPNGYSPSKFKLYRKKRQLL